MNFYALEQNISTTIYEGLLKIGYLGKEDFSIYYDLDLLNHLLESQFKNNEECYNSISSFTDYMKEKKIPCTVALLQKRFCFTISQKGIEEINKHYDNPFLKDLIELVKGHVFTLEDVLQIFKKHTDNYICEDSSNEEFQYVIYFRDSSIDPYRYCFSFDGLGGYYHRLLEYDYNKL